jgi:hypothetical protein
MAILDRFRSLPANKHPDPEVRLAYLETLSIDDREPLASAAREDESARVRRAAVGKLMDPSILALVARDDPDTGVRAHAMSMLRDIALEAFEETGEAESLAAIDARVHAISQRRALELFRQRCRAISGDAGVPAVQSRGKRRSLVALVVAGRGTHAFSTKRQHRATMSGEFKDAAVAAVERLTDRAISS